MSIHGGSAMLFSQGGSSLPVLLAAAGIVCGGAGALLLRPWPPAPLPATLFALVLGICVSVVWRMGTQREVRLDLTTRSVAEHTRFAALGQQRQWAFHAFQAVQVQLHVHRLPLDKPSAPTTVQKARKRRVFRLHLLGPGLDLRLAEYDSRVQAEAMARAVAALGGWPARRQGYALEAPRPAPRDDTPIRIDNAATGLIGPGDAP